MRAFSASFALVLAAALPAAGSWESTGPEGGPIERVVEDPSTGDLYAATYGSPVTVLRSGDGGLGWTRVGSYSGYAFSLAACPDGRLVAGGSSYAYVSTDGGATWTSRSVSGVYLWDMEAHPTDPDRLIAAGYSWTGSPNMVFAQSDDGGMSWTTRTVASDTYGYCIDWCRAATDTIFIGGFVRSSYDPALYRSTDGGSSWTMVSEPSWGSDYYLYGVAVHPTDPDVVCAGTYYHLFRSEDCGESWTQTASKYYNYEMAFSPADPSRVYSGAYNDVYYSSTGGAGWSSSATGPEGRMESVAPSLGEPLSAYAAGDGGFYRTVDGGVTWTPHTEGMAIGTVLGMQAAPSDRDVVYLSMENMGLYRTEDHGSTWLPLDQPLSCGDVCGFTVSPSDPDVVCALEGYG